MKYSEGEKVLCFHGPLLYEAKCIKVQIKDKQSKYFIHYSGWNKNWDEWVPESRVLKYNDLNLQKQKELEKIHVKTKKSKQVKLAPKKEITEKPRILIPSSIQDKSKPRVVLCPMSAAAATLAGVTSTTQLPSAPVVFPLHHPSPSPSPTPSSPLPSTPTSMAKTTSAAPSTITDDDDDGEDQEEEDDENDDDDEEDDGEETPGEATVEAMEEDSDSLPLPPVQRTFKPPLARRPRFQRDNRIPKFEVKMNVPQHLKAMLIDDWDFVINQKRLVHLPATLTAQTIIANYLKHKLSQKEDAPQKQTSAKDVAKGIKTHFNVMLGKRLLYKFERPQYQYLLSKNKGKPLTEIYGAIHLLRMAVEARSVLSHSPLDRQTVTTLWAHFQDFIDFLGNQKNLFDCLKYEVASPEYHRQAL